MSYLLCSIVCIIAVELFLKAPLAKNVGALAKNAKKSSSVILSSKISDHWKEKVLLVYSKNIATSSIKLFLMIGVIFLALFLVITAIDVSLKPNPTVMQFLSTGTGIIFSTVMAIVYYYGKRSFFRK